MFRIAKDGRGRPIERQGLFVATDFTGAERLVDFTEACKLGLNPSDLMKASRDRGKSIFDIPIRVTFC